MKVLSIDVGIKNLSYVFIDIESLSDNKWKILDWNNINILHNLDDLDYIANEYKKWSKLILQECATKLSIFYEKKETKENLQTKIKLFLKEKKIKKSGINLQKIVKNIEKHFKSIFVTNKCDVVLIENQPCLKNPQMKTMQIIIFTYFCLLESNYKVKFISASEKLKYCVKAGLLDEIPKKDYKKTKKKSIDIVSKLIKGYEPDMWVMSKKKDDLSDVLLQAFAYCDKVT